MCDDDTGAIKRYAELITTIAEKHCVEIELSYFFSGVSLLLYNNECPNQLDIIYLDIRMDTMDGMNTARELRQSGCFAHIVFLTNYEEYVFDAFDVDATHYLLKEDISVEKFEDIFLSTIKKNSAQTNKVFSFVFAGKRKIINSQEIMYFEIWRNRVAIHLNNGNTDKFYERMDDLEQNLAGQDFIRVHRSYLVHLPYIAMLKNDGLLLKNGEIIPIGITRSEAVEKVLSEYIANHHIYPLKIQG